MRVSPAWHQDRLGYLCDYATSRHFVCAVAALSAPVKWCSGQLATARQVLAFIDAHSHLQIGLTIYIYRVCFEVEMHELWKRKPLCMIWKLTVDPSDKGIGRDVDGADSAHCSCNMTQL